MKRIATKTLATITTVVLVSVAVAAVIVVSHVPKSAVSKVEGTLEPGKYQGYYIRCYDAGQTITEVQNLGPVTHTYEHYVFRCTANAPGELTVHKLNLGIAQAAGIYVHWSSCEKRGLLSVGDFIVNDSEYDIVLQETLDCVSVDADPT